MRRRQFIGLLSVAATQWTRGLQAQERVRRVGILAGILERSDSRERVTTFQRTLDQLGWADGHSSAGDFRLATIELETSRQRVPKRPVNRKGTSFTYHQHPMNRITLAHPQSF